MSALSFVFHVDSVPMTKDVIDGKASLGGSESACLGLARALRARGHNVHIVTTRLADDVPQVDGWDVTWHRSESLQGLLPIIDPDVFVALRSPAIFGMPVKSRLNILWNQDMLAGEMAKLHVMSLAWAYDVVAYVSEYHRKQWEGVAPELAPIGWVTRNGFDPAHVPADVKKVSNRIIHISRPERAMLPLLTMWPELKRRVPDATLQICRYQSMYDGEGSNVKAMCESYDRMVEQCNGMVGGIEYLGSLGKKELYKAIAEASVMWYPGVVDFAETSCIAAIEAQACGTPFVGSYKGALPETVPYGVLTHGDAMSPEYQRESIDSVVRLMSGGVFASAYAEMQRQGRTQVASYTFDRVAEEWEAFVWGQFDSRLKTQKEKIVAQLLHEDDHVAAAALSEDPAVLVECERVMKGEEQGPEAYAKYALDPEIELTARRHPRMDLAAKAFEGCTAILDLACGNGAFALNFAKVDPARHVHGIDYAKGNIDVAREAAIRHGVADRVTFQNAAVCDLFTGEVNKATLQEAGITPGSVDGVFLGEFCEHVAGVTTLLRGVREAVGDGVRVVITVPSGPFSELLEPDIPKQKGHVHHFRPKDLQAIFSQQKDCLIDYWHGGNTARGEQIGHWIVRYTTSDAPLGRRPLEHWHRTIRPKQVLSVGILANDCTPDLARCLNDVYWVADQIVIADCASQDRQELERLAARYRAEIIDLPHVATMEGGFSEARNETLKAARGDWFLWIDADEQLVHGVALWKYLQSKVYRGFAIKQNHMMLDAPPHFDTPIRVFRKGPDIQFYGCVHEQPQMGDCNGDIVPALQLNDTQIAHTGYMHEGIRRHKATSRNLPLLVRDTDRFKDRRLGKVLWVREFVNQALWREETHGESDPQVRDYFSRAMALFETHFMDPADKYHPIARPFYECAVRKLSTSMEVEYSLAGAVGGLNGRRGKPLKWWVRDYTHVWPLIEHEQQKEQAKRAPIVLDVEPVSQPEGVAA
jgi:glycosyltransferase involved in cell wall biosynthesis/SAM-dependent methyltransferase